VPIVAFVRNLPFGNLQLGVYVDGKPGARAVALEELQRMARIADSVNGKQ